jgi:hypothetical protein
LLPKPIVEVMVALEDIVVVAGAVPDEVDVVFALTKENKPL